jgi:PhoPQ-activated pathogenicity-related protein
MISQIWSALGVLACGTAAQQIATTLTCASGYAVGDACVPVGVSPLQYYMEDKSGYAYDATPIQTFTIPNVSATLYVLNMTSGNWIPDALFNASSPAKGAWMHQVLVIVPAKLRAERSTGWLWITGGANAVGGQFSPLTPTSGGRNEIIESAKMAVASGTVGVVLKQVPNQPVIFEDEPYPGFYPNGRSADGIIAYGWDKFIAAANGNGVHQTMEGRIPSGKGGTGANQAMANQSGDAAPPPTAGPKGKGGPPSGDATWMLRLPMTRAVSRAMDAVIDYMGAAHGFALDGFVVGGASKRGWTTWTTGLVEPRCRAIVPVVMDLLNMPPNQMHTWRALGGWTFAYEDYVLAGLVGSDVMASRGYNQLLDVVDAFAYVRADPAPRWPHTEQAGGEQTYADRFAALPKFIVNGGNDEFFLPTDNHYFWGAMRGETHLLHIPNAGT